MKYEYHPEGVASDAYISNEDGRIICVFNSAPTDAQGRIFATALETFDAIHQIFNEPSPILDGEVANIAKGLAKLGLTVLKTEEPVPGEDVPTPYIKAYDEGYQSFVRGKQLNENPYHDEDRRVGWVRGWQAAKLAADGGF